MKWGFFLGDFKPSAKMWKKGEVAVRSNLPIGWNRHYFSNEANSFFLVIMKGKVSINGHKLKTGQVLCAGKNEKFSITVIEECSWLRVEIYGKDKSKHTSFCKMKSIYNKFLLQDIGENSICAEDISVIVQGAVDNNITPICLESIRYFLPGSKIILSTWEGSDITDLKPDFLVESRDPGYSENGIIKDFDSNFSNNVNRQIVSTQAGLREVHTLYSFKLRSDMILLSNAFLSFYDKFPLSNDNYRIFEHKVIISDLVSRHMYELFYTDKRENKVFKKYFPLPFHPSDWFFFGQTKDLLRYFKNTPLIDNSLAGGFADYVRPEIKEEYRCSFNMVYTPEQYLAISALKNLGYKVNMKDWTDYNDEDITNSEYFMMNNFIILDFSHHGLFLPKYKNRILSNTGDSPYCQRGYYTFNVYKRFYDYLFRGIGKREQIFDV